MKVLAIVIFLLHALPSMAQWQPVNISTSDNGDIYHLNGSIGIGTSNPKGLLHAEGLGSNSWIYFANNIRTGTNPQNIPGLAFGWNKSGAAGESLIVYNKSTGSSPRLSFSSFNGTTFTEEMVLANGSLGIATTPGAVSKLAIAGGGFSIDYFGSISSARSPINSYTNVFLGGGIEYQNNGTYKIKSDGGSNYFAALKMDNSGGNAGAIKFYTRHTTGVSEYMLSDVELEKYLSMSIVGGNVGIGTASPDSKLAVNGTIHSREVKVDLNNWPDYVFNSNYRLPSLSEVESYIKQNKHLPEVPSKAEVKENGLNLGEINALLLKKVEELTLYMIEQNKRIEYLTEKIESYERKK